jgi:hypothetical protein
MCSRTVTNRVRVDAGVTHSRMADPWPGCVVTCLDQQRGVEDVALSSAIDPSGFCPRVGVQTLTVEGGRSIADHGCPAVSVTVCYGNSPTRDRQRP